MLFYGLLLHKPAHNGEACFISLTFRSGCFWHGGISFEMDDFSKQIY